MSEPKPWFVYVLKCADDSFYTGITVELERRVNEHNDGKLGAKYTRARRPVALVYFEEWQDRVAASKREYELKAMTRKQKERLVAGG